MQLIKNFKNQLKRRKAMTKKPTYNDFRDAKPAELMKTYKLDSKQLEMAQRAVNPGANQRDLNKEYEKFYRRNRHDA